MQEYYDSKTALLDIQDIEGNTFRAVPVPNQKDKTFKVLVYEEYLENYPTWNFFIYESVKNFYDDVLDIDWIKDEITQDDLEFIRDFIDDNE
jgi:hypothetical protein